MRNQTPSDLLARSIFDGVRKFVYDNGLTLYVLERPESSSVSVQSWVKTGSIHEGDYLGCGLSHFLEHMLFQGCSGYPEHAVADTINNLGGDINAYTSYGETVYQLEVSAVDAEKGIDILCSMIKTPDFPEEKFLSEKAVILRERDMLRDNPGRSLLERLWREVFLAHPVRHTIIGYHEKIVSVTREMMVDYYQRRYSPERSFIIICGGIKADDAAMMVGKRLEDWKRGNIFELDLPREPEASGLRRCDIFFKDPLARLSVGLQSPSIADPQVAAVDVLSGIIGQSQSSRLIQRLQLERELALTLNSFNYSTYFCGMTGIFASCTPAKMEKLEHAIREELKSIANGEISAKEVDREVLQQSTDYLRMLSSNSGLANTLGSTIMAFGNPMSAGLYYDRLNSVDIKNVRSVAAHLLQENRMAIVRQYPEKKRKNSTTKSVKSQVTDMRCEKLSNGARLVSCQRKQLPLIDICVVIPGGTILEKAANSGISALLASMLSSGTQRWNESELGTFIDENALDLNITAGRNSIVFRINCRTDRFDAAMALLESIIAEPMFNEKIFKRERSSMIENLKSRVLIPSRIAGDKAAAEIYGAHPYSRPIAGTMNGLRSLTIQDLYDFYYSCLVPGSVVFGVAGNFDRTRLKNKFEKIVKAINWSQKDLALLLPPPPEFKDYRRSKTLELPREQCVVLLALPGCENYGQVHCVFDLLENALNGMSSKLFKTIREDAGLAYSTGVEISSGIHRGMIILYAITSHSGAQTAMSLLEREVKRIRNKGLDEAEFQAAVRSVAFDYERLLEKQETLIFHAVLSEYYGNGCRLALMLPAIYRGIKRKEANAVIKNYLNFPGVVSVNVLSDRKQ
ncbi:MAG: pitrilysin family protein [Victivallaceae bacterium]|nr:pitrilysin family protein [Victivallaceae bacterium]MDD4318304.1 pitrilysin family protein [Victivallaceae bacterium]